jgi:hypothetical protein
LAIAFVTTGQQRLSPLQIKPELAVEFGWMFNSPDGNSVVTTKQLVSVELGRLVQSLQQA